MKITIDGLVGRETLKAMGLQEDGTGRLVRDKQYTEYEMLALTDYQVVPKAPDWVTAAGDYLGDTFVGTVFGKTLEGHQIIEDYELNTGASLIRAVIGVDFIDDAIDLKNSIKNFDFSLSSIAEVTINTIALAPVIGVVKQGGKVFGIVKEAGKYKYVRLIADAYDEVYKTIKNNIDKLFELVQETKDLGDRIWIKLRNKIDGVDELEMPKKDFTPKEQKIVLVGCFVGDTLIKSNTGLKRIDEIQAGDLVLAKSIDTGEITYKPAMYTYKKYTKEFVKLKIGGEIIETTPGHPFCLSNGEWKNSRELEVGDKVLNSSESYDIVEEIENIIYDEEIPIYNFTVDEFHTYYVSNNELLVHNQNNPCADKNIPIKGAVVKEVSYESLSPSLKTLARQAKKDDYKLDDLKNKHKEFIYGNNPEYPKTIATDGHSNTASGWNNLTEEQSDDFKRLYPNTVIEESKKINYSISPHDYDKDYPGQYNASHAEKQLLLFTTYNNITVSNDMC